MAALRGQRADCQISIEALADLKSRSLRVLLAKRDSEGLSPEERREIGQDIATVEYGWPVGMPVCRPLGQGLWEVRSSLSGNRIARVIFCIAQGRMVTQKIPNEDLALARRRMKEIEQ